MPYILDAWKNSPWECDRLGQTSKNYPFSWNWRFFAHWELPSKLMQFFFSDRHFQDFNLLLTLRLTSGQKLSNPTLNGGAKALFNRDEVILHQHHLLHPCKRFAQIWNIYCLGASGEGFARMFPIQKLLWKSRPYVKCEQPLDVVIEFISNMQFLH